MAIAYSSAGAGAGTETSGANLSLACPSVVGVNDILIAHVIYLDTSTTPSTPSGWTLLHGPQNVGAVGRHWIFGKVAVGNEDGTSIVFGSSGGTAGRFGRIYSFTGYVSGSITDVVLGFSSTTSNNTSAIAMPSVTTTKSGSLAVCCAAQDDNNTFAAPTGESGGDWTEPVAEFVSTTIGAQGCINGIAVATPTGNPGTISGGTIATVNADDSGAIAFEIRDSLPALNVTANLLTSPSTINQPTGSGPVNLIKWEAGDPAKFTRKVLTIDPVGAEEVTSLSVQNGRGDIEVISGDSTTDSNQRDLWILQNTNGLERAQTQFYSGPASNGSITPQHGIALRFQEDASKRRAVMAWQNIAFGSQWTVQCGVWSSNLDGTGFLNRQTGIAFTPLFRNFVVTAASRTSNVVTLTIDVSTKHNAFAIGDRVNVALTDTSFDGSFIITGVTPTTVSYAQTGANDADGGTGTVRKWFPYWCEARMPDPESDVLQVRVWSEDTDDSAPRPDFLPFDSSAGLSVPSAVAGVHLTTPDTAVLDITGDIFVAAEATLPSWAPSIGNPPLLSKYGSTAGTRSWMLSMAGGGTNGGKISFIWTTDGTNIAGNIFSTVVVPFADGEHGAVAAHLDVDNGSGGRTVIFYTAPGIDGPWTPLGDPVVITGGTTSIFSGTSQIEVASNQEGANSFRRFAGTLHAAQIRNGNENSPIVFEFYGPQIQNGDTSFNDRANALPLTVNTALGASIVNPNMPSVNPRAITVRLNKAGTISAVTSNPTPVGYGSVGIAAAHLGNDSNSRVVYGPLTVGFLPDTPIEPNLLAAPETIPQPAIEAIADTQNVTANILNASATVLQPATTVGAVTVTPNALITSTNVRQPTITVGSVTITTNLLAAPANVRQPTIANQAPQSIGPNLLSAPATVRQPTVAHQSPQSVSSNVLAAVATIRQPSVTTGPVSVVCNVLATSSTILQPSVTVGGTGVSANLLTAVATILQPSTTVGSVNTAPNVLTAVATVRQPTVSLGAVGITNNVLAAPATILASAITQPVQNVSTNALARPATILTASITQPVQSVTVNALAKPATILSSGVTQPVATLSPNLLTANATILQPIVTDSGALIVSPNLVNASVTIRQASITTGPVTVVHNLLVAAATVRQPTITQPVSTISPNVLNASATILLPSVEANAGIQLAPNLLIQSSTIIQPTVTTGSVGVMPETILAIATIPLPVVGFAVADNNPVVLEFKDLAFSIHTTSDGYAVDHIAPSRHLDISAEPRTLEVSDSPNTVTVDTPTYNFDFTEGG